jgi:protein-disulfide isomerase
VARKSSNNSFGVILGGVAVVGVAVLGYVMARPAKTMTLDPATLPAVAAAGILKGNPDAPVQVLEFADFECPGCGYYASVTGPDVMKRLVETGEVSFRFFDFPLDMHPNAIPAHNAAHCANEQGKFWEMHDLIFAGQFEWNTQATKNPKKLFKGYAQNAGLDVAKWEECFDSERMLPQILANRQEGARLRVNSTPTFIIGGRMVTGAIPYDQFRAYVLEAKVAAELAKPGSATTTVPVP